MISQRFFDSPLITGFFSAVAMMISVAGCRTPEPAPEVADVKAMPAPHVNTFISVTSIPNQKGRLPFEFIDRNNIIDESIRDMIELNLQKAFQDAGYLTKRQFAVANTVSPEPAVEKIHLRKISIIPVEKYDIANGVGIDITRSQDIRRYQVNQGCDPNALPPAGAGMGTGTPTPATDQSGQSDVNCQSFQANSGGTSGGSYGGGYGNSTTDAPRPTNIPKTLDLNFRLKFQGMALGALVQFDIVWVGKLPDGRKITYETPADLWLKKFHIWEMDFKAKAEANFTFGELIAGIAKLPQPAAHALSIILGQNMRINAAIDFRKFPHITEAEELAFIHPFNEADPASQLYIDIAEAVYTPLCRIARAQDATSEKEMLAVLRADPDTKQRKKEGDPCGINYEVLRSKFSKSISAYQAMPVVGCERDVNSKLGTVKNLLLSVAAPDNNQTRLLAQEKLSLYRRQSFKDSQIFEKVGAGEINNVTTAKCPPGAKVEDYQRCINVRVSKVRLWDRTHCGRIHKYDYILSTENEDTIFVDQ